MPISRGLVLEPHVDYIQTPYFDRVIERALLYLKAGVPLHLQGPAGTGKTTCALQLARLLKRPVAVIFGNDQFTYADLVGRHFGMRRKLLIDQYIHTVERREEEISADWVDGRLLTACKEGYTLVYDEFSRSRPEANNVLIPVLEEGLLELPATYHGEKYVKVHPEFRVIFTSNPEEYAGVHQKPDALLDRMISIDLSGMDEESELTIVTAKTGISPGDAAIVVGTVRQLHAKHMVHASHSIRASLLMATVLQQARLSADPDSPLFQNLCRDILGSLPKQQPRAAHVADDSVAQPEADALPPTEPELDEELRTELDGNERRRRRRRDAVKL